MKKWKAVLSILFVFVLGAVTGALVTHKICQQRIESIIADEPRTTREFIVQRLSHELHLDSAQTEQLRLIVRETRTEMKSLRQQIRPELEKVLAHSQDKVRAILRPDQLEMYEKIISRHRMRHELEESDR